MGIGALGLQGIIDRAMGKAVGGVFKGAGGFVTGLGRGLSNQASNAYSKAGIGKITNSLGYGIGRVASVPITGLGFAGVGAFKGLKATLPRDIEWAKKAGHGAFMKMTKETPKDLAEKGYIGIGGRIVNKPTAWGISAAAVGIGMAKGVGDSDYNIGIKYATNGIMDTEGVALTPGSVGASFTPVTGRKKNNGLRDLGTDGALGFALHDQRNTGQIRR